MKIIIEKSNKEIKRLKQELQNIKAISEIYQKGEERAMKYIEESKQIEKDREKEISKLIYKNTMLEVKIKMLKEKRLKKEELVFSG